MDWTLTVVLILTFFFAEGQAEETKRVYRYWKNGIDHFYTTDQREIGVYSVGDVGKWGYKYEGVRFRVLAKKKGSSKALYRYWNQKDLNHFYTTNLAEIGVKRVGDVGKWGYKLVGTLGYCFQNSYPGTLPLYRYYHGGIIDHFYTTNWGELGTGKAGWNFRKVECYVYPA